MSAQFAELYHFLKHKKKRGFQIKNGSLLPSDKGGAVYVELVGVGFVLGTEDGNPAVIR